MPNWICEHVNHEPLKPASSNDEYALHLAALEWSLAEPIIIAGRGDIKSEANWKGRFDPYEHQVQNLITFCRRLPVTLLADDVGLGKTISAGLILAELIERKRVNRTLVICPSILGRQWEEELEVKFRIGAKFATGADFDEYRERSGVPVLITTYDTARRRLANVRSDEFEMLILDEAHKLRNLHGTPKTPEIAERVRDALKNRVFKYVLMLTATPIQNRVWDLYSLIDLLTVAKGHRNPLGQPWEFQAAYLNNATGRTLNQFRADQFRSILRQYLVRTRREDAKLKFPKREVETRKLPATQVEGAMLDLVTESIGNLNGLAQVSIGQSMMSSPQALASQLENMAVRDGRLRSAAEAARALADRNPMTAKLRGLMALVDELRQRRPDDWRLIVFTLRKETQEAIGRALEAEGIRVGFIRGGQTRENNAAIQRFRSHPPGINVIISTDAGAEGVNLQVCNVLVNYDLPWNPMIVEQRIGRVQRLGTKFEHVVIVNFAIANSVEERVVARLVSKLQIISHTIGDIEAILESAGQDEEGSYEEMIRKLVVDSLKGVNVEEATRKQTESIDRAKELMERERQNIDNVFGNESSQPDERLRPPKVAPVQPSMRAEQFVVKALAAEGATVRPRPDDTLDVVRPGKPVERITFKPEVAEADQRGVFMGNAPKVYLPGRPPFEKLVQRWLLRAGHCLRDLSADLTGQLPAVAASWCNGVPDASFVDVQLLGKSPRGEFRVVCKAKAANGVDSLEKIVHVQPCIVGEPDHPLTADDVAAAPLLEAPASLPELLGRGNDGIANQVVQESDVKAFCDFYDARLREELGKCGSDAWRRNKVEADLAPKIFAEVVGLSGFRYDLAKAKVVFRLGREHEYAAEIEVLPGTERVLAEPPRHECAVTGRSLPDVCLAKCDISGESATAHLLVASSESRRRALPKYAVTCAVSGATLLADEVWESALTGKRAAKKFFKASPISGRRGLPEDFRRCDFTGAELLLDEVAESQLSGRPYRTDQRATCAVTGAAGHTSEFVRCQETKGLVAPAQMDVSAYSKLRVRKDLLVRSEKPPHRLGLERETVTCVVSGLRLLADEVVRSAVSDKPLDRELAVFSSASGKPALPDEVVYCEVTGKPYLPTETAECDVSGRRVERGLLVKSPISGRKGLASEFAACEITGTSVLRDELVLSDESAKRFRKDQMVRSAESGKIGHLSEVVTCSASGQPILRSESAQSSVSGKAYSKRLLILSEKSQRLGLESELIRCEKTGRLLLSDEVAVSAASGKSFDRDQLIPSDNSRKLALPEEMRRCDVTGAQLLPAETDTSDVSGRVAGAEHFRRSPVSGRKGLADEFKTCELTGDEVLRDELLTSDESGRQFRKDQSSRSDESGRVAHVSETVVCATTGARLLRQESGRSAVTGTIHSLKVLRPSEKGPGRLGVEAEFVTCARSGRRLLRDEVTASAVSGLLVDTDLLAKSDRSGRPGLPEELVKCEVSGRVLLPEETALSAVSGRRVGDDLLRPSALSGRRGLPDEFARCEITGAEVLQDELLTSDESGRRFRKDEAATSDESGRIAHVSETVLCGSTGRRVLQGEAGRSALTGKVHSLKVLMPSEKSPSRLGLEADLVTCAKTGRRLLCDEVTASAVSGKLVDTDLLVPSAISRKLALAEEMVVCAKTRRRVLPDETVVCAVSGLRVAASRTILGKSEVSGKPALLEQLAKCEVTGKTVLPAELSTCEITGKRVLPSELATCAISHKRALKDRLLVSDLSGAVFLPEYAVRSSLSRRICMPAEAVTCTWLGEPLPRDEVSTCRLTGLPFAKAYLNDAHELKMIRELLDGREIGTPADDLRPWLGQQLNGNHGAIKQVSCTFSPDGRVRVACAESRAMLGLKVRHVGCVINERGQRRIAGRVLVGRRNKETWAGGE